jgi:hypothetical protein
MRFTIGLDLGQRRDPAAIVIVEKEENYYTEYVQRPAQMMVRYAATFPLGTPYPVVVAAVRSLVRQSDIRDQCSLVLDITGVGIPVADMFRSARLGCGLDAVTITSGGRQTSVNSEYSVPRQDLISGVQLMLEQGLLRISAAMPQRGRLVRELMSMRMTRSPTGNVRLGADGSGEHDDLVIALALAVWRAKRKNVGYGCGPGIW